MPNSIAIDDGRLSGECRFPTYILVDSALTGVKEKMLLTGRILVTLSARMLGLAPVVADVSGTHALNPQWPGHARFHSVWLLGVLVGMAVVALVLAWRGGRDPVRRLRLATLPGWIVLASFFIAAVTMPAYGGTLRDDPTLPDVLGVDGNLFLFPCAALILATATIIAARLKPTEV